MFSESLGGINLHIWFHNLILRLKNQHVIKLLNVGLRYFEFTRLEVMDHYYCCFMVEGILLYHGLSLQ